MKNLRVWFHGLSRRRKTIVSCVALVTVLWVVIWLNGHLHVGRGLVGKLDSDKAGNQRLVVLVHGLGGDESTLQGVREIAKKVYPGSDYFQPKYVARPFSNTDPEKIASQLEERVYEFFELKDYTEIILIGHSMGGLIARRAYLMAADKANPDAWSDRVTKIVSLAGINRGWSTDSHSDWQPERSNAWKRLALRVGEWIARFTFTGHMARSLKRGAPFVGDLRVQWVRFVNKRNDPKNPLPVPVVVHLVGTEDDVISRRDSLDLNVSKHFYPLEVPGVGHGNLIDFEDERSGRGAAAIVEKALKQMSFSTKDHEFIGSEDRGNVDLRVKEVIIVKHGIRDYGRWPEKFAQYYKSNVTDPKTVEVHAARYARLPMFRFLFFGGREDYVNDLMDEYTEIVARYPNVDRVHFVGHSNGTYLLARALEKYKTLEVDRVVFAGSVVPRDYGWRDLLAKDITGKTRVGEVLNYVGTDDWVVAVFPRMFELIKELTGIRAFGLRQLGSSGYAGFLYSGPGMHSVEGDGGHGWAIAPERFAEITNFLRNGGPVSPPAEHRPSTLVEWASNLCWIIWLFLLAVIVSVGEGVYRLLKLIGRNPQPPGWRRWTKRWVVWTVYAPIVLLILMTA